MKISNGILYIKSSWSASGLSLKLFLRYYWSKHSEENVASMTKMNFLILILTRHSFYGLTSFIKLPLSSRYAILCWWATCLGLLKVSRQFTAQQFFYTSKQSQFYNYLKPAIVHYSLARLLHFGELTLLLINQAEKIVMVIERYMIVQKFGISKINFFV